MTCTTVKPKGTLDAMTAMSTAMSAGSVKANGPEDGDQDPDPDWYDIDWDRVEDDMRRLRQRIFAAARDGDHQRVHNLQKLMLRSRSNALLSGGWRRSTLAARPQASTARSRCWPPRRPNWPTR